jgi:hypothetical protein
VFAINATQRDEFAYRILHALEEPIHVYNYNEGFPEDGITPSELACLIPESITMQVVRIMPELVSTLYYRSVVFFTAYRNEL